LPNDFGEVPNASWADSVVVGTGPAAPATPPTTTAHLTQQVGHQWELSSGGRCVFLFAVECDDAGRDVFKQAAHKLA